jgi:hypothetical protein
MKLKLLLLLTVTLLGFGFMRSDVVQAQEDICTTHCGQAINLDWQASNIGCSGSQTYYYTYWEDGAWRNCAFRSASRRLIALRVVLTLGDTSNLHTINNFDLSWQGDQSYEFDVIFYRCHSSSTNTCQSSANLTYTRTSKSDLVTNPIPSVDFVYSIAIHFRMIDVGAVAETTADGVRDMIVLNDIYFCSSNAMFECETPEYHRPLRNNTNLQPNPLNSSAINVFGEKEETVYAATDGIITIERLTTDDCRANNLFGDGWFGDSELCYFDGVNSFRAPHLSLNIVTAKVTLNGDDGSQWEYWVHSPILYSSSIQSGGFIKGGCPIGGTISSGNQGVTIVFERGGDANFDYMTLEPDTECDPLIQQEGCITQISPTAWEINGGIIETHNGNSVVSFHTVGSLKTVLNVPMDRTPKLRLYVYSPSDAKLNVAYGENIHRQLDIPPARHAYNSIDIELDGALPDRDPFYTLEITLLQPSRIVYIGSICLFLDNTPPREYCYFINNDFANGLSDWNRSSPNVVSRANNTVFIPDTESIWQNLKLVTGDYDDDLEFNVRIEWGVFDNVNSVFVDNHYLISLEYKWGGYTDDQFQEIGMATRDIVSETNNTIITAFNLLISQNIEADFELRISHSDLAPPPPTLNAEIRSICLTGDVWPEDKPAPPFNASCPLGATRPTGSDLGLWIGYLWSELSRFFTCDLMQVLNQMHANMMDFFDTSRYFMRYLMVSGNMTLSWFSTDMLYWLNGHLSNIAGGNVTFIEVQGGKSCNNLFCVIDGFFGGFNNLLNFLGQLLDQALAPIIELLTMIVGDSFSFLIGLAQSIIDLLLTGAYAIINLGEFFFSFLWKILNDFTSAEPIQIPLLPYCDVDPTSSPACRLFWVAEHTVFSGPGAIIIPIFTGYLIVIIMLYMIKETKQAIMESGKLI